MKLLILLTPLLLNAWTFTKKDLENYSAKQLEVLEISYLVGEEKDRGLDLAAIAVVETQAGKFDFKKNHICGAHQIDINYAKVSCEAVESNPYLSAKLALANLQSWEKGVTKTGKIFKRSKFKQFSMYNGGYSYNPHAMEYYKRIHKAKKILKRHYFKED